MHPSDSPILVDEESKLQGGASASQKHQYPSAASEGTVNGSARSRSGSNHLSPDVQILHIPDSDKDLEADSEVLVRKKVPTATPQIRKKTFPKTKGSSVILMEKQRSQNTAAISLTDSDEDLQSLKVNHEVVQQRKTAVKKGKMKAEAVPTKTTTVRKLGSAVANGRKVKNQRRQHVPLPCIAWRTRSFLDHNRDRVRYSKFFEEEQLRPNLSVSSDNSVSYSNFGSLESSETEEDSQSGSDSDASSDSVTESKSSQSDETAPSADKKKRYKGDEPTRGNERALPLRKEAGKVKDVEEVAVFSEDSEDVPILERKKKKVERHEVHGEGCSRAQQDEWASLEELVVSSSDESHVKVEKVAKKIRCEKEKPVERDKRVDGLVHSKRKREKPAEATKDLLDYLMNIMDGQAEEASKDSESEVDRNPPQELPLVFDWSDGQPPVEKSEFEQFEDEAWQDFDDALMYEELGTYNPHQENERDAVCIATGNYCADGKHEMYLDEEIGYLCRRCSFVETEIRHILPVFAPKVKNATAGPNRMNANILLNYDNLHEKNATCDHSEPSCQKTGTVWDLIPGVIDTMYPHQREAFEFIWRNLAGGIQLGKLKKQSAESNDLGGCVISHAPGTGKTRLAIVFIQSYLKAYPNCNPIVFAPASIMHTWETEFKKWDFDLPFHNMNTENLTGKEDAKILDLTRGEPRTMQVARTIKLCSWVNGNGVLGMSYDLFRDYVRGKSSADSKEREVLLEKPGLIVLDEGHTPRNDRSRLYKAFSEVKTEKRIILSGTPFQNTFLELHNTLCLVRPRFAQTFAAPVEKQERAANKKKQTKDVWNTPTKNATDENADKVRSVLKPFVHVHTGDILKSLPGLRECVIMLNPEPIQREAIQNLSLVNNSGTFDSEYKTSLASIHPFLLTSITKITEGEASLLKMDMLKGLRHDPYAGAKTKFVMEFVRLLRSDAVKERVLIFSQYIEPLNLIKEQLMRIFQWTEETEVLQIYGKIQANDRQRFINSFNDMGSNARVLLASTRACSEGISLTGASRVIMLDVVWNPAVGKQAISRAFRIGQEKFVYTYNLITTGTGEMDKYDVQGKKDKLSKLVFSPEVEAGGAGFMRGLLEEDGDARQLVAEDKLLEKLTSNDNLKGMFAKIYYNKSDD